MPTPSTPPAWNDTFTAGDFLYSEQFVRDMLYAAMRERMWAFGSDDWSQPFGAAKDNGGGDVPYLPGLVTDEPLGDPAARPGAAPPDYPRSLASAGIGSLIVVSDPGWGGLGLIQYWLEFACTIFVDPDFDPVGSGDPGDPGSDWPEWNFTLESWRAKCGFPDGFRRKKPRYINTTTDTEDTDGNTAATGQIAYGPYYNDAVPGPTGCLWQHNGAVWEAAGPNVRPDVLDSDEAAPDHCEPGLMQPGDYIGPWLHNQIRDGLNQLVVTPDNGFGGIATPDAGGRPIGYEHTGGFGNIRQTEYTVSTTPPVATSRDNWTADDYDRLRENVVDDTDTSWAAAKSGAEGEFTGGGSIITRTSAFGDFPLSHFTEGQRDGADYTAGIHGVQARLVAHGASARLSCTIKWWGYIAAPDDGDVNSFSATGLPGTPTEDEWAKLAEWTHTGDSGAAGFWTEWDTASGVTAGSISSVPTWGSAPPDDGNYHALGWMIKHRQMMFDYRVAGGFAFTAGTGFGFSGGFGPGFGV